MTEASNGEPTLGSAVNTIAGDWAWFIALGVSELMLGGIASANVLAASPAPLLVTGAAVAVAGMFQIIHACSARGLCNVPLWLLAGLAYAAAGAIILHDPVIESPTLALTAGALLVVAGLLKLCGGFHSRPAPGWGWIATAGILTFCVGLMLVAAWPLVGLWLLGATLVVDLTFQAWGLIAFGLALRASRRSSF